MSEVESADPPATHTGGDRGGVWGYIAAPIFLVGSAGLWLACSVFLVISGVRELLVYAGVIVDDVSGPWPLVAGVVILFSTGLCTFGWFIVQGCRQAWGPKPLSHNIKIK